MISVNSTAIARVDYVASTRTLRLEYTSGRIYVYFEVPPQVYEQLLAADSVGEFVNREIKPRFDCAEVE